jgi:hypothetical protein
VTYPADISPAQLLLLLLEYPFFGGYRFFGILAGKGIERKERTVTYPADISSAHAAAPRLSFPNTP